jgi:hypothetical protein
MGYLAGRQIWPEKTAGITPLVSGLTHAGLGGVVGGIAGASANPDSRLSGATSGAATGMLAGGISGSIANRFSNNAVGSLAKGYTNAHPLSQEIRNGAGTVASLMPVGISAMIAKETGQHFGAPKPQMQQYYDPYQQQKMANERMDAVNELQTNGNSRVLTGAALGAAIPLSLGVSKKFRNLSTMGLSIPTGLTGAVVGDTYNKYKKNKAWETLQPKQKTAFNLDGLEQLAHGAIENIDLSKPKGKLMAGGLIAGTAGLGSYGAYRNVKNKMNRQKMAFSWQGFKDGIEEEGIPLSGAVLGAGLGWRNPLRGAALGYLGGSAASVGKALATGEEVTPARALLAASGAGYGLGALGHMGLQKFAPNAAIAGRKLFQGHGPIQSGLEELLPATGATLGAGLASGLTHNQTKQPQKLAFIQAMRDAKKILKDPLIGKQFEGLKTMPKEDFKRDIDIDKQDMEHVRRTSNAAHYYRSPKTYIAKSIGKGVGKAGVLGLAGYGAKSLYDKHKTAFCTINDYPDDGSGIMRLAKEQDKQRCYSIAKK